MAEGRSPMIRALVVALLLALGVMPRAWAQVAAEPGAVSPWRYVDPAHEDLDLHARSLRKIDPGLAVFSDRYRVQQNRHAAPGHAPTVDPELGLVMPHAYRYVAPGVEIRMGRAPDYLVRRGAGRGPLGGTLMLNAAPDRDGAFRTLIPSDSVFVLTPVQPATPAPPPSPWRVDARVGLQPVTLERASGAMGSQPTTPMPVESYTRSVPSRRPSVRAAEEAPAAPAADTESD